MSYEIDRAWSDAYLPAVRQIVGPRLLVPAPLERDRSEATDLIVMRARDMTIGARLRRPGYAGRYPGEFTIRSDRESGQKTELAKIIEGWGDWLFYGHADGAAGIAEWYLVDLHKLRRAFIVRPEILHRPDNVRCGQKSNRDGTYFRWFRSDLISPSVMVDSSRPAAWVAA